MHGFVPIIDDTIVSPGVLDLYLALLRTRPVRLVQLVRTLDVVQRRYPGRDEHAFEMWSHLDVELRNHMSRIGLWLVTSDLTEDETVDAILAQLDHALISR